MGPLFLVALLFAGFDSGILGACVRADPAAAHSQATHTPAVAALRTITTGAVGTGEHEPAAPGDLTGRHGRGVVAILIGAQHEIVAVDGDFLSVLGLHFNLGHDVVPTQIGAEGLVDGGGIDVDGDVEDQVFVFAASRRGGLFGGAGDENSDSKEERNEARKR